MYDSEMAGRTAGAAPTPRLEMRWLPVTDERGHTQMQAVWIEAAAARSVTTHHAA